MLTIITKLSCENCGKEASGEVDYHLVVPSAGHPPSIFPKYFFGEWRIDGKKIVCCRNCIGDYE